MKGERSGAERKVETCFSVIIILVGVRVIYHVDTTRHFKLPNLYFYNFYANHSHTLHPRRIKFSLLHSNPPFQLDSSKWRIRAHAYSSVLGLRLLGFGIRIGGITSSSS